MKRFTINTSVVVILGLGIALALLWLLGGGLSARAEPAAEGSTEPAKVLHVCLGGCLSSSDGVTRQPS